jgi:hypothetical protein
VYRESKSERIDDEPALRSAWFEPFAQDGRNRIRAAPQIDADPALDDRSGVRDEAWSCCHQGATSDVVLYTGRDAPVEGDQAAGQGLGRRTYLGEEPKKHIADELAIMDGEN